MNIEERGGQSLLFSSESEDNYVITRSVNKTGN